MVLYDDNNMPYIYVARHIALLAQQGWLLISLVLTVVKSYF